MILGVAIAGCMERSSTLAPPEDVGTSESPIINGYIDEGHPSVGLVYPSGCTATLVGRRTALTAAHCVNFSGQRNTFCTDGRCMDGTAFRHPGFEDGDFDDSDVAVVRLDGDFYAAFGVIPTRLSWSPPSVDEWTVIVGFGCTEWDTSIGYGTKRFGYAQILDVDDTNIQWDFQSRICQGDSGGPTFKYLTDCQVGVHSHRQDFLHGGDDADMRVDVYQGWMRGAAADGSLLACGETICGDGICHPGEVGCDCSPSGPPGYQGCFTDAENRALPAFQGEGYSLQACVNTCASQGYAYAGSQWYSQCFCGNSLGYSQVSDAECNTPCSSGGGYCGGAWRNSIYATGATPPGGGAMQADSAVRGCSNWSWWSPVYKPDAASCSSYCVQNGANACEWYAGNGDCYVEFASGGCYVASGFPGWYAAVY